LFSGDLLCYQYEDISTVFFRMFKYTMDMLEICPPIRREIAKALGALAAELFE